MSHYVGRNRTYITAMEHKSVRRRTSLDIRIGKIACYLAVEYEIAQAKSAYGIYLLLERVRDPENADDACYFGRIGGMDRDVQV